MSEEFNSKHYRVYPRKQGDTPVVWSNRPLPPNTLTNSDGSPYSAGHDEKTLGQIAYEAFANSESYLNLMALKFGYRTKAPDWDHLIPMEQRVWQDVAEAVKNNETLSQ